MLTATGPRGRLATSTHSISWSLLTTLSLRFVGETAHWTEALPPLELRGRTLTNCTTLASLSSLLVVLPLPKLRPRMRMRVGPDARKHGAVAGSSATVAATPDLHGVPSAHLLVAASHGLKSGHAQGTFPSSESLQKPALHSLPSSQTWRVRWTHWSNFQAPTKRPSARVPGTTTAEVLAGEGVGADAEAFPVALALGKKEDVPFAAAFAAVEPLADALALALALALAVAVALAVADGESLVFAP